MSQRIPPQRVRPVHYEDMEKQLTEIFKAIVFDPIYHVLRGATDQHLNAAETPLRDALRRGRVQYGNGVFSGQFNSAIARYLRSLGAKFDARGRIYRLAPAKVPSWVSAESGAYQSRARDAHAELKKTLGYILSSLDQAVDRHTVKPDKTLNEINTTFRAAAKVLRVAPELTDASRDKLRQDYTDNMKLWIRKFSEEMIADLRIMVDKNAVEGFRFDKLIDAIQNRYSVTESKAKFLARQETSLFMAKFRQQRYGEAGVTSYRWGTSGDARVRDDHRKLNGKIFSYKNPPIVDSATGRKANPGEDYNCRCIDEPILVSLMEAA